MNIFVSEDTVWTSSDSLDNATITVLSGATLTLSEGFSGSNLNFSVFGDLNISGNVDQKINLFSSYISSNSGSSVVIDHAYFVGRGGVDVIRANVSITTNSHFDKVSDLKFGSSAEIESNIFEQSSGLSISGFPMQTSPLKVEGNEFYFQNGINLQATPAEIENSSLNNNSFFLNNGQFAFKLPSSTSPVDSPSVFEISGTYMQFDPLKTQHDFVKDWDSDLFNLYDIQLIEQRFEFKPTLTVQKSGEPLIFGRDVASPMEFVSDPFFLFDGVDPYSEIGPLFEGVAEGSSDTLYFFVSSTRPPDVAYGYSPSIKILDGTFSEADLNLNAGYGYSSFESWNPQVSISALGDVFEEETETGRLNFSFDEAIFWGGEFSTSFELNVLDGPIIDAPVEGSVNILGTVAVGEVVTASTDGLSDANGLGSFSYQWYAGQDKIAISGANSESFLIPEELLYLRLSVDVTHVDGDGFEQVLTAGVNVAFDNSPDENNSGGGSSDNDLPVLRGPEQSGSDGVDVFEISPTGSSINVSGFQLGNDILDLRNFDRSDALNAFFTAASGSVILRFNDGTMLTVEGEGVSPSTLEVDDILLASGNLPPSGAVVLSGDPVLGRTLTADVSNVTDPEGIGGNTTSISWQRNGNDILDASGPNYTITQDDVGAILTAKFSYTDQFGSEESVQSFPTAPVLTLGQSMNGTPEPDFIVGTNGTDLIKGFASDDVLFGQGGNDLIDGGLGNDTALYSGSQTTYSLTVGPSSILLLDRSSSGSGEDRLIDVEALSFGSGPMSADVSLVNATGVSRLTEAEFETVIELYIAYFNRSPDAVGLNFWGTAFANGTTLEQMATLFVDQDETRATYPEGTSNTDFVTAVYDNVLGRIPDQAGFDFWIDMLNRSEETGVTRDQFILEVLQGVQNGSSDRAFLDTKVDIGAYFAVHRGMSDVDNASSAMALFDGSQASINQAVATIDGFYQDALDPDNGEFLMQVVGVLDNPFIA